MDRDVDKLLKELGPTIDEKCMEIKKAKEEKMKERLFIFVSVIFLIFPSTLVFLNINIIYILLICVTVILAILFIALPFVIQMESRGACYE